MLTDAARAPRAGRHRRTRTATSRTSRRSSSPTPTAASSSRRAIARGPRARSAPAPRSRTASASAPTGRARRPTSRAGTDFDAYRWPRIPTAIADDRLARHARARRARRVPRRPAISPRTLREPRSRSRAPTELPGRDRRRRRRASRVCMHRRESHSQTTASMIAELRDGGAAARVGVPRQPVRERVRARASRPRSRPSSPTPTQWQPLRPAARPGRGRAGRARRGPRRAGRRSRPSSGREADAVVRHGRASARSTRSPRTAFAPVDAALHRLGV